MKMVRCNIIILSFKIQKINFIKFKIKIKKIKILFRNKNLSLQMQLILMNLIMNSCKNRCMINCSKIYRRLMRILITRSNVNFFKYAIWLFLMKLKDQKMIIEISFLELISDTKMDLEILNLKQIPKNHFLCILLMNRTIDK